jgi:hypothetical protein
MIHAALSRSLPAFCNLSSLSMPPGLSVYRGLTAV